jgi:lipid-binding SYLF domain-containing protein
VAAATWAAVATVVATLALAAGPDEVRRLTAAAVIAQDVREQAPDGVWRDAHCVLVLPALDADAGTTAGDRGESRGVMSCRTGDSWTAPLFMTLASDRKPQPAAGHSDLVLLVMNESGVDKLLRGAVTLGATASSAAGPSGPQSSAGDTEILAYARSSGVLSGTDASGGVLAPDAAANRRTYGADSSPRHVLAMREISAPPAATPFLRALGGGSSAATPTSPASGADAARDRPPADAAVDTDAVRARLLDVQRSLDRLLTDTGAASVGTAGAPESARAGMITIDRARLIQLRRQIEAAIAALGRR